jgi:glycosyltransferase involved in cell wall biosynthesis
MFTDYIFFKSPKTKDSKTKVLIATGIFPPDIGGPATILEALAYDLCQADFSVKIITYADQAEKNREKKESRALGRDFEVHKIIRGRGTVSHLKYFWRMLKLGRRADIIYVTDTYSVGYFAYLIKKIFGKKYVVRFAGDSAWETAVANGWTNDYIADFQKNKYNDKIEALKNKRKKILVNADKVIAVSDFMNRIAKAIGVDGDKIKIIYNSVDFIKPDNFNGEAIKNIKRQYGIDAKIIVTACRLTPWKGVDGIIRIMPKLITRLGKINFLVLGDGQELNNLKELSGELRVNDNVHFLGRISQSQIINYFKVADLFILNTNYEGLSHTILEVMTAGTPVLTTNAGGNPEIIDNNKDGLLVNFNNEQELLLAAVKILSDQELTDNLVKNASAKLKKFNWSDELAETIKLLKEVYEK